MVWASLVLGFVLFLLLRDRPFSDPNFYLYTRILLSFGIAVLGATIPGFLDITWHGGGLAIRAAGALGLFVLTFFGTPKVLPSGPSAPRITLNHPPQVTFRTFAGPEKTQDERLQAPVVLTVPFKYLSVIQPALSATIAEESARVEVHDRVTNWKWKYFVSEHPENIGKWLGIDSDVHEKTISGGAAEYHETAMVSDEASSWRTFAEQLQQLTEDTLPVRIRASLTDRTQLEVLCDADLKYFRKKVSEFLAKERKPYMRATLPCLSSPT
jgi:hypothetical protein